MAYIKCPECGKENEELAKECRFCGTVLIQPHGEKQEKPAPESVDDFLASLQKAGEITPETSTPSEEKEKSGAQDEEISDFISRLRDFSIEQEVEMGASHETAEESLPDWIKELDSWKPTSPVTETGDFSTPSDDEQVLSLDDHVPPQWLEAAEEKAGSAPKTDEAGEEETPAEEAGSGELSDWLSAQKEDQIQPEENIPEVSGSETAEPIIDLPSAFEEFPQTEQPFSETGIPESAVSITPQEEITEPTETVAEDENIPQQEYTAPEAETSAAEEILSDESEVISETAVTPEEEGILEETEIPFEEIETTGEAVTLPEEAEAVEVTAITIEETAETEEAEIAAEEAEVVEEAEAPGEEIIEPVEAEVETEVAEVVEETEIPVQETEEAGEAEIIEEEAEVFEEAEAPVEEIIDTTEAVAEPEIVEVVEETVIPVEETAETGEAEIIEEEAEVFEEAEAPVEEIIETAETEAEPEEAEAVEETEITAEETEEEAAEAETTFEGQSAAETAEETSVEIEATAVEPASFAEVETPEYEPETAVEAETGPLPEKEETVQNVIILGQPDRIYGEEEIPSAAAGETESEHPEEEIVAEEAVQTPAHPEYPGEAEYLPPFEAENLGEWLGEVEAGGVSPKTIEPEEIESEEKLSPDWEDRQKAIAPEAVTPAAMAHPEYPGEENILPPVESENLSEWLGELQAENFPQIFDTAKPEPEEEPSNATPPFVKGDLDAWMKSLPKEAEAQEQPAGTESIAVPAEPLPEWMKEISPEEEKAEQPGEAQAEAKSPETDIPGWLAALQPLKERLSETVQPSSTGDVEQTGPLAGIPGILPVFEASVFFRKPPVYSSQVNINDQQRVHAAALAKMLEEEKTAVKKKRPERKTPHDLLRALIGILLIGVMLLPVLGLVPSRITEMTGVSAAPETAAFLSSLESLPDDSPVLVAVEYSPGYDDELGTAATAAFELLMKRNARIAAVSTNPTGLILAEGIKNKVLASNPDLQEKYSQRDWFINMGYLPGETLSLQELAVEPRQAARYGISAGLENRLVWDSGVLSGIQDLNDFTMLVLITDTIETGRAWIEQVRPSIPDVTFLVVSSAQAAPMLQPYVSSGQVQAMVSGMAGGYSLRENSQLHLESDRSKWTSSQFGTLTVILFIFTGIIVDYIKTSRTRRRLDQEVG